MKFTFTLLVMLIGVGGSSQVNFQQLISKPGADSGVPRDMIVFNDELYYRATSPGSSSNQELWKTNGTQEGTMEVADVNVGTYPGSFPDNFTIFNGFLYFTASSSLTGEELYKSNGTLTSLVKDIQVGLGNSMSGSDQKFTILNNQLYFFAREDDDGYDLWRTDGTLLGTQKVMETNAFGIGTAYLVTFNNKIYFNYSHPDTGNEMYVYDDVLNTITVLKDIYPGVNGSSISEVTIFDNQLFFVAEGTTGIRLWTSNGTSVGTVMVNNPLNVKYNRQLFGYNSMLLFTGTTDSFPTSTNRGVFKCTFDSNDGFYKIGLVKSFNSVSNNPFNDAVLGEESYRLFVELNSEVYFAARETSTSPNNGLVYQIYKTNGTAAGTQVAVNIGATQLGTNSYSDITNLIVYNNKLYFQMSVVGEGQQLWMTDGTNTVLQKITNFSTGANVIPKQAINTKPIVFGTSLYFEGSTLAEGSELWRISEGTLKVEQLQKNALVLYPNPTNGLVNLNLDSNVDLSVEIYESSGKKVGHAFNQSRIDLTAFASGIYFLKIYQGKEKRQVVKVIKK